jgi:hypothetical protein
MTPGGMTSARPVVPTAMPPRVFILSPANLTGVRARQLMSLRARFEAALRYRTDQGVPIAEAFAFMSALYFRGKIAYARQFAAPDASIDGSGIYVIAPGFGLVAPEWAITQERMKTLRKTEVDLRRRNYRKPLERDALDLASRLPDDGQVILLGSVATGKYVDLLWPIFGQRLRFPRSFAGIGDMSRGALMLRAARSGEELEYTTLDAPRHREKGRTEKELNDVILRSKATRHPEER